MDEFKDLLLSALDGLNEDHHYTITTQEVIKHNNTQLTGVIINPKESNIGCTFYLEDLYRQYQSGISVDAIAHQILNRTNIDPASKDPSIISAIISKLLDFDYVRDKIQVCLLNLEKNGKYLSNKVFYPYLEDGDGHELAICLSFAVPAGQSEMGRITVTKQLRSNWDVSDEKLLSLAIANTKTISGFVCQNIYKFMVDLVSGNDPLSGNMNPPEFPVYVLTNQSRTLGAATILFKDELMQLAEKLDANFFIIPSSIHECILIVDKEADPNFIQNMILEVNESQVPKEDVLSNKLLYFSRSTGEVSVYHHNIQE